MFCPNCGIQDHNRSQFCRTCGAELHIVRTALEQPDAITVSSITARDQIGQAIADRIKELRTADDLKGVAQEVLPQIEKFLESPEERRLRRLREGTITAAVGLGLTISFLLVSSIAHSDGGETLGFLGAGSGIIVLMVGLGIIVNALWLTVLPKRMQASGISKPVLSDEATAAPFLKEPPSSNPPSPPFTESTTRQLK